MTVKNLNIIVKLNNYEEVKKNKPRELTIEQIKHKVENYGLKLKRRRYC